MAPKRGRGRPARKGEPTQAFVLRLPVDLHQWLGRHAAEHLDSVNRVIVQALLKFKAEVEGSVSANLAKKMSR